MKLYELKNGIINLHPHRGQLQALGSDKRVILMLAGTQGGKTSLGPWWLLNEIYGKKGRGSGDYLAVTSTYDLFKLKLLPEMLEIFENITKLGRYYSGDRVLELRDPSTGKFWAVKSSEPMWGRIILRSANVPSALESATAKAAWLDEAGQPEWTIDAWEAIQRRTAIEKGRILITTTPYYIGWLKYDVYDHAKDNNSDIELINFPSSDNPSFPKESFERARRTMDDWKFKMFYEAQFERPHGLIYSCFNELKHVINIEEIDPNWHFVIGIDPGAVNTAIIVLASNDDNKWIIVDEYLVGNMTSRELANFIRDNIPYNDKEFYGGSASEKQFRYDMQDNDIFISFSGLDDVETGIDRVTELLKTDRLFISSKCRGTIDEFGSYMRKANSDGTFSDVILNKHAYHHLDGLRYAVVGLMESYRMDWLIS